MLNWIKEKIPEAVHVKPLTREASQRSFFRLEIDGNEYVLMFYPDSNPVEIARISHFTKLYLQAGIHVPKIYKVIDDQALLLEDLGRHYFQFYFKRSLVADQKKMIEQLIRIGLAISAIPAAETPLVHDLARQRYEMDFFIDHYFSSQVRQEKKEEIKSHLYRLVDETCAPTVFAHRDYHSRNILVSNGCYGVVDFQDSMLSHPLYDLASLLWDAYLPWTESLRVDIVSGIRFPSATTKHDLERVALQRTIKALGTFAFQVKVRKNLAYSRYIGRVIRSIVNNEQFNHFIPSSLRHCFLAPGQKKCNEPVIR